MKKLAVLCCHLFPVILPVDHDFYFIYLFIYLFFRSVPAAYGGSRAKGLTGATAAHLCCSNAGSELRPRPTPQLIALLDP